MSAAEVRQMIEALYQNVQADPQSMTPRYRESIARLHNVMLPFFTPDANGEYAAFGREQLVLAIEAIDSAFEGREGASENDKSRLCDLTALLARIDVTKGMTLPQSIDALKTVTLRQVTAPGATGAASSSRKTYQMALPNGSNVNGYFTEEEKYLDYDRTGRYMKYLEDFAAAYPKNTHIRDFVANVRSSPNKAVDVLTCFKADVKLRPRQNLMYVSLDMLYHRRLFAVNHLIPRREVDDYCDDPEFAAMLIGLRANVPNKEADRCAVHGFQYGENGGVAAVKGSSLPGRNVAMSCVANLLGVPHLLARTQPVSVEVNGKKTPGVFMEAAAGNDLPKDAGAKEFAESAFGHADPKGFTGKGLRDMADLQVLDYICLNADRHGRNMLYSFDEKGKLSTVVGIDNDLSFGTKPVGRMGTIMHSTSLENMKVMSASMADRVSKLNVNTLAAALRDTGLKQQEIFEACQRLTTLQHYIAANRATPRPEKITDLKGDMYIVPDNEWDTFNTADLWTVNVDRRTRKKEPNKNIFYFGTSTQAKIAKYQAKPEDPIAAPEKPAFGETILVDQLDPAEMETKLRAYAEFRAQLFQTTQGHKHKLQFDAMMNALDAFVAHPIPEETPITVDQARAYQEALRQVRDKTRAYMDYKIADRDTRPTGVARLGIAKKLFALADKQFEEYRDAVNEYAEKNLSDDFLKAKAMEEQYDLIYGTVIDKLSEAQPGMDRRDIQKLVKDNGVLDRLLSDDDALPTLASLAERDPAALMRTYREEMAHPTVPAQHVHQPRRVEAVRNAADGNEIPTNAR